MTEPAKQPFKLTLFDLDHTLIPIDSDYSWGVFTTAIGWTDPIEFQRKNDEFFAHYKAGTLDIADYVRFATEAIRIRGPEASALAHERFMREVIEPALLPQAMALVQRHRDAGETILIVTATNAFVTRPIAKLFGVDDIIAVELERGLSAQGTGWFTGNISGVPSAREGKVVRVEQWLAAHGLDWNTTETCFYTDSINDLALLEKVNFPVATNPDDRLREVALARDWPVLDLFKKC